MRRNRAVRPLLQAAAAAVLVIVGIQLGRQMSPPAPTVTAPDVTALRDEVRDLRQMVTISLMQQQSVTERLKGVSWSSQLDQPGNEVVAALIDTLMHDANVNVRLASIDALKRFAEREVVRSAAVRALDTQKSPLVQMALIDFVVETQDREALDSLRRLSRDEQADEAVRARASWGIDHLEAA
jgi:HEAT repeat protein